MGSEKKKASSIAGMEARKGEGKEKGVIHSGNGGAKKGRNKIMQHP